MKKNLFFSCDNSPDTRVIKSVKVCRKEGFRIKNEAKLLRRLKAGESAALGRIMEAYTPYVAAIVRNIIDPPLQEEDVEEVVADVFLALWRNADDVGDGKLCPWLAAVTRNRAKDKLRALHLTLPLEDDALELAVEGPETEIVRQEAILVTKEAVDALGEPDRSIFRRYYYLYQKTDEIAADLGLKPSVVRNRLSRGREKIKMALMERGLSYEDEYC